MSLFTKTFFTFTAGFLLIVSVALVIFFVAGYYFGPTTLLEETQQAQPEK